MEEKGKKYCKIMEDNLAFRKICFCDLLENYTSIYIGSNPRQRFDAEFNKTSHFLDYSGKKLILPDVVPSWYDEKTGTITIPVGCKIYIHRDVDFDAGAYKIVGDVQFI